MGCMMMKTVVVTGATSGIGYAVCDLLLANGYAVIGIGRTAENSAAAREKLQVLHPTAHLLFLHGNLMEQYEVLRIASEIYDYVRDSHDGNLYALINNAGGVRSWYATTGDGLEQQFALNYMSGFLLTHELLPLLRHKESRVIFTSSQSHKFMRVNWSDLMFSRRYRPLLAYKQSKLLNLLLAYKLNALGVRAYGVDPGLVQTDIGCKGTGGVVKWVWDKRKRHGTAPEIPAKTYLTLCNKTPEGLYFRDSNPQKTSREVSLTNAQRLYDLSLALCGADRWKSA